jgi:two-component system, cell cycle response regulator DivK
MATSRSVLVIDDDPSSRLYLQQLLSSWGLQVVLADEGQMGIDLAQADPPALVITDLDMPVLDGWQTIQRLKGHAQTRDIPVVALTGKTTHWDRDSAHDAGVDFFLAKPADTRTLRSLLDHLMQQART